MGRFGRGSVWCRRRALDEESCCEETGICEKLGSFIEEKYIMAIMVEKEEKIYQKVLCSKQEQEQELE